MKIVPMQIHRVEVPGELFCYVRFEGEREPLWYKADENGFLLVYHQYQYERLESEFQNVQEQQKQQQKVTSTANN